MIRHRRHPADRRRRGLSLIETLLALAISALLLTAVAVALHASLHAYATAAETASAQTASRMFMQRLLSIIRTATLHDAYDPNDDDLTLAPPSQPPVQSVGIQMIDPAGRLLKVWWQVNDVYADATLGDLHYQVDDNDPQPFLEQVRVQQTVDQQPYVFTLASRSAAGGLLLSRATVDITVVPGEDATLMLESVRGQSPELRLVASTMPRKNLE